MLSDKQKDVRQSVYAAGTFVVAVLSIADLAVLHLASNMQFTPVSVFLLVVVCVSLYLPTERFDALLCQVGEQNLLFRVWTVGVNVQGRRNRRLLNGGMLFWLCLNGFFVYMIGDMTYRNVTVRQSLPALVPTVLSHAFFLATALCADVHLSTSRIHPVPPPEP